MDAPSKKADTPSKSTSSPDDLVKDLEVKITEDDNDKVKGGRATSISDYK